ncbi:response regulator [Roseivivax sp. CAU 1753]
MMDISPQLLNIILVEDDDGDAKAIRRALVKAKIANPVQRVMDGVEALALLRGVNGHIPRNFVILLDLNMPRMNGIEFMAELRNDPDLNSAIVFVMTTSRDERDRADAYSKNVAGYILKSNVGEDFIDLVNTLDLYWRVVELPTIVQPMAG